MHKVFTYLGTTLFSLLIPTVIFAQFQQTEDALVPDEIQSEIVRLKASLEENSTHLEYTKYRMLTKKYSELDGQDDEFRRYYSITPRGISPLQREYLGLPITTTGDISNRGLSSSIGLITGENAINESLQTDSIGQGQANELIFAERNRNESRINSALRSYNIRNDTYPEQLEDLLAGSSFISEAMIEGFIYENNGDSYTLIPPAIVTTPIPISEVEGLTIVAHPWEEMIGESKAVTPDMYNLIPDDYFFVHFNSLTHFRELELTLDTISGPLADVYGLGGVTASIEKVFDRLGVLNEPALDAFIEEVAFISYDFDGYPGTDYALILKPKLSQLDGLLSRFISGPTENRGSVGAYYVIATSRALFDEVSDLEQSTSGSMAESMDLQYSLVTLDEPRDGFAFISDAFVSKVTSPAYRISASRRNAVMSALETLQYATFAYRSITGDWPLTVSQMIDEDYLEAGSVSYVEDYSIDADGVVSHTDWGSVYKITPIQRVEITDVEPGEKIRYDRFREGYQSLWQEFIDPVAVSILVGDQIKFHTIILPLINDSEYNWVKTLVGDVPGELDFVARPDRIPAIQLASKFDLDNILHAWYLQDPSEFHQEYNECFFEYRRNRTDSSSMTPREFCDDLVQELDTKGAVLKVKEFIASYIQWEGDPEVMFGFMGDEISLAASEGVTFELDDISAFDVYLGVELKDRAEADVFINHVFDWITREWFGGESIDGGLFSIKAGQPIKNSYNEVDFYMIPTGWINLFYIYIDDRLYFTLSQQTINKLIDGRSATWPEHMKRLSDYLSPEPDVSFMLDGNRMETWIRSYAQTEILSYGAAGAFAQLQSYLSEVEIFEETVSPNNTRNDAGYYSHIPKDWFGLPVKILDNKAYIQTSGGKVEISSIEGPWSSVRYSFDQDISSSDGQMTLSDLMEYVDVDVFIDQLAALDTFGTDLKFTEHGLDISLVFNNHARNSLDERIAATTIEKPTTSEEYIMMISLILILMVIIGGVVTTILLRRKSSDKTTAGENNIEQYAFTPNYNSAQLEAKTQTDAELK